MCFSNTMSMADELNLALTGKSGKTGQPYGGAVVLDLYGDPSANMALVLQSVATAGWNPSANYGSKIGNGKGQDVTSALGCLLSLNKL
jgi:hypothetical protein